MAKKTFNTFPLHTDKLLSVEDGPVAEKDVASRLKEFGLDKLILKVSRSKLVDLILNCGKYLLNLTTETFLSNII